MLQVQIKEQKDMLKVMTGETEKVNTFFAVSMSSLLYYQSQIYSSG